jgi:hypothetical protein
VIGLKVVVVVVSAGVEVVVVRAGVVVAVGVVVEELDGVKLGENDNDLDIGDEEGGDEGEDNVGEWDEVGGSDEYDDGGVRDSEVEGDVDGGVEEDTEEEDVDSGGSEDTDLFVVREYLCENSAEIPTKHKHEGDDTPKMNGKTQRSEECTYNNGGGVDGVVLDDVVVGGSEDGGGVPEVGGVVSAFIYKLYM